MMAPRGMLMPMPTLAESARPDDDGGTAVGVAALVLGDAGAADEGVDVDAGDSVVVLTLKDPDVLDAENGEDTIEACPSVRRL